MPISSNSLFHFTNSLENLFSILKNDFIPKYSLEKFYIGKTKLNFAFPMVCFCDIPLSQIKQHLKVYGYYGIGLTKKWGKMQELNPILYLERKSRLSKDIAIILNKVSNSGDSDRLGIDSNIGKFLMHIKQYKGVFRRRDKNEKEIIYNNYLFYNEREWRYVPKKVQILDGFDYNSKIQRNHYNSLVKNDKLLFTPDDIKYLIINNSKELAPVIKELRRIRPKYSPEEIDRVISRILTVEQIREDF